MTTTLVKGVVEIRKKERWWTREIAISHEVGVEGRKSRRRILRQTVQQKAKMVHSRRKLVMRDSRPPQGNSMIRARNKTGVEGGARITQGRGNVVHELKKPQVPRVDP